MLNKHTLAILLGFILLLLLCVLLVLLRAYPTQLIVQLPFGYFPQKVFLEKGEKLLFVNLTTTPVWPAAGPHPTHTSYASFDPQTSIPPLGTWSFIFEREGTYTFHDHLHPAVTGVVVSGNRDISDVTSEATCSAIEDPHEAAACMEIYFRNVVKNQAFDEARALFIDLSTRYQRSCHTFAHDLGKNAYHTYREGSMPEIGSEASSCGYGFWHGFTTAMQAEQGIEASKEFCASLSAATVEQQNINRMNCYHGVGIGLIPDPPPPQLWGNFSALTKPAVAFCDTIDGNVFYRERCLTGIYHALTIYMDLKQYGFTYNEQSLSECRGEALDYQRECFITLVAALPQATAFNLERTVTLIQEHVPPEYFLEVFEYAAVLFIQAEDPIATTGQFIASCEAFDSALRDRCLAAAINKLYNNGIPGIEYQKVGELCVSEWVYEHERQGCFDGLASYASAVYDMVKVESEVCPALPSAYRSAIVQCAL